MIVSPQPNKRKICSGSKNTKAKNNNLLFNKQAKFFCRNNRVALLPEDHLFFDEGRNFKKILKVLDRITGFAGETVNV